MSRRTIRSVILSSGGEGDISTNLWMVPYADLMSNLMILFLALFAVTYSSNPGRLNVLLTKMAAGMDPSDPTKAKRLAEAELAIEMQRVADGLNLEDVGVSIAADYIDLSLPSPVLFTLGSDRLSPKARTVLHPLSRLLAKTDNPILVAGHTDDIPIVGGRHKTNWELSAARAFSVIEYFTGKGLPPARFRARGYGEFRPKADNATPEGRGKNRRIEIRLIREARKES